MHAVQFYLRPICEEGLSVRTFHYTTRQQHRADDGIGNTSPACGIAADLGLDSPNVAQSCIATRPYHL